MAPNVERALDRLDWIEDNCQLNSEVISQFDLVRQALLEEDYEIPDEELAEPEIDNAAVEGDNAPPEGIMSTYTE